MEHCIVSPRARHVVGGFASSPAAAAASFDQPDKHVVVMDVDTNDSTLKTTSMTHKRQLSNDSSDLDDIDTSERSKLLAESEASAALKVKELEAMLSGDGDSSSSEAATKAAAAKTSYVAPQTVIFWLSMWFVQNIGVTFWNKKALNVIRLPVTVRSGVRVLQCMVYLCMHSVLTFLVCLLRYQQLTFVHMICNTIGACLYIYVYGGIERKPLKPGQQSLMVYFSLIFVSNIITGNWSLGLVSITFNQVMRALVPGVVVGLSMLILGKSYSRERKLCLVPVACGVYLACTGDKTCTFLGLLITLAAVLFAGLKVVLSNKFLSGDLKLHPVDLILHQAPLSAFWCLIAMVLSGEWQILMNNWDHLPELSTWYLVTGVISFLLNVTSFYANKVTSPVTLCVCGNMKQIFVITLSIVINHDVISNQRLFGICVVTVGGAAYAYISNKEMNRAAVPVRPQHV